VPIRVLTGLHVQATEPQRFRAFQKGSILDVSQETKDRPDELMKQREACPTPP
jgi:hypothetical protein